MENQIIKGMFCRLRDTQKLKYMLDKNFVNNAYFILAKLFGNLLPFKLFVI